MKLLRNLVALILLAIVAVGLWMYSGLYNIGADVPHAQLTRDVLQVLRDRSIQTRAKNIGQVPDLKDPALIKLGAQHYREMCTGCHLAPGMTSTEMRQGLYPKPPNLTDFAPDPRTAFWVIKHGIKMSAMPAWGKTHDDHKIWAMVAYLQQQPGMTEAQYKTLSAGGEDDDDHDHAVPAASASSAAPAAVASVPAPASTTSSD